jgi:hypothetical protein
LFPPSFSGRANRGLRMEAPCAGGGGCTACGRNVSGGVRQHLQPGSRRAVRWPEEGRDWCGGIEEAGSDERGDRSCARVTMPFTGSRDQPRPVLRFLSHSTSDGGESRSKHA